MSATLTITRTSLALADLVVPSYEADGVTPVYSLDPRFAPGSQETSPIWVQSPFTAPIQVGEVPQPSVQQIPIHAYGADEPQLWSRMTDLVTAFRQLSYQITYAHGTYSTTWKCGPASYGPGDGEAFADDELASLMQAVVFTVPRQYTPVSGGPF